MSRDTEQQAWIETWARHIETLGLSPVALALLEIAHAFVKKLKNAGAQHVKYMRIDGAGHGLMRQHADKIGPAMEKFFAKHFREK